MVIYIEDFLARQRKLATGPALRLVAGARGHSHAIPAQSFAAPWRLEPSSLTIDVPSAEELRTLYAEATLI